MIYAQLVAFPILALGAIWVGLWESPRKLWWVGVVPALVIFGLVILGHRVARLQFVVPISWAVNVDWSPLLMTASIGVLFATLIPKLPQRRVRVLVGVLTGVMLAYYGLLPAVMPLMARATMTAPGNLMDRNGICRQRYAFTCGPAAAVTCLQRFGIASEEVGIAVEARSSPMYGTDGHLLAAAMTRCHPGMLWQYRHAERLEDVRTPAVADVVLPGIGGHFVALLEMGEDKLVLGDPMGGRYEMTPGAFLAIWQHGVVEIDTGGGRGG